LKRRSARAWLACGVAILGWRSAACAPRPPVQREIPSAAADELVARNLEARGGVDKIRAIRSLRITGTLTFDDGGSEVDLDYAALALRPGRRRSELTQQGMTAVDAWDGQRAWSTEPFGGRREPFLQSADTAKPMAESADLDGSLVDYRQKGHHVDYLGTEEIDGTFAHRLRVTLADGNVEEHDLDPDTFLDIRIVRESYVRGAQRVDESDVGDYQQVAGVWMPFSVDSGPKGEPRSRHLEIERIEPNVDVDPKLFAFPDPGSKVARAIEAGPAESSPAPNPFPSAPAGKPVIDSGVISGLGARNIGSAAMSGRIAALAATVANGKTTLYVGAASGGVWKSLDGGTTFKPVFDEQPVQSIGAIAIDPSNPSNLWVGTGESWTRNSASIGDGIYKSTDAGESWTNVGLTDSERVARILVHPRNGNVVYACVPGKLWSDSAERGVYRTTDGGKTWNHVLAGGNLSTGCSGLGMDPRNPDVLFAGLWDFRRKGWTYRSGGEGPDAPSGSGLFRSADGGTTWTQLTPSANPGLPAGPWGRVEVVVAPSDPKIVYALIESKDSALFASSDGGRTWQERDKSMNVVWRPFYFARLVVDPTNPLRVFKPDLQLVVSEDGGKSFTGSGGGSHGDWHDLWIDPTNPSHVVGGDDGGLWTSWDGGNRWWKSENLPISQFYHVSVDDRDPYQVYGGLQDNASWVGDSSYPGGITNQRWEYLYDGDGFWVLPDPTDRDGVYVEAQGGYIARIDRKTRAIRDIQPKAGYHEKLRFNWNSPIHVSPTQPGTLYVGAQFLFRSRDRGATWERISPDLTTNDPEKQKQEQSGGVTVDNSSAEMHTTIYSISESPRDPKVIWAGTDDGNLQLTRDAGKSWINVATNVAELPAFSWVSWVEASRHDAATAYATFDRHTFGDMSPWVYQTRDFGRTWTRIVGPEKGVRGYAHVIKEDVRDPALLFLGTELGLWISTDGGASWAEFKGGDFPSVAVRDLAVQSREGDLVIATHGRGLWIVDDLEPLRHLDADLLARPVAFLPSRPVEQRMPAEGSWVLGDASFRGESVPEGAVITYYQRARHVFGRLDLEVLDPAGNVVDTIHTTKRRGINRVVWSMQVKPPRVPRAASVAENSDRGPRVVPGQYRLRLTRGGESVETQLDIQVDRRAPYGLADRQAEFDAAMQVHALFGRMSDLVDRIDEARASVEARVRALPGDDPLASRLGSLATRLDEVKKKIVATKEGGGITGEERIREQLDFVYGALLRWEGRPTSYQIERIGVLAHELDDVAHDFEHVMAEDARPLDPELRARSLDALPSFPAAALGPV